MAVFGSIGIGFVWGWLLGLVIGRRPRPFPARAYLTTITPLLATTGGFVYAIQTLFGITNSYYFLASAAVAGLFHHAILHGLRLHYDSK